MQLYEQTANTKVPSLKNRVCLSGSTEAALVCRYICSKIALSFTFLVLSFGTGILHLIQINHQPHATIFHFIILTSVCSSTRFGRFPAHHQELNDCSSSRPAQPRTQHDYHHDTKVKPETATAVIKLLMTGGKTPETC
jgi:hypothetical protein